MSTLGMLALALMMGVNVFTVAAGVRGGVTRDPRWSRLALYGQLLQAGLVWVAAAALMYAFVTHDFSLPYVYGRSDTRMPILYVMSSFWGGQEGSLLFWTLLSSAFGAGAAWVNRDRMPGVMPWFAAVHGVSLFGLLWVLNLVASPFDAFVVVDPPLEGNGLNPLLQNPLMVIHPPMLLSGFATFSVPWAFGMAALLAGDLGHDWLVAARRWTLTSWLFLSVGNILGGMWAYRELGWGGYWGWDPVENAALIPWFTASAFLHSVIIQEQRGMLRRWNVVLVALTFLLTILGTWMTRSGLIESVHTFAESEIGGYFFTMLIALTTLSVGAIALRWKALRSERNIESTASREGAFLLNNWVLVAMAFVVLWGTLFPKVKEMLTGEQVSVGPTWYDQFMAPMGLLLLALIGLGTLLPWRRVTQEALVRNFSRPLIVTLVLTPLLAGLWWWTRGIPLGIEPFRYGVGMALVALALIVFNLATLLGEFAVGIRARMRTTPGLGAAVRSLLVRHRRRYGGYVVHVGVVLIFLAFLGNAVKVDLDVTMTPGQSVRMGDYTMHFEGIEVVQKIDRREVWGNVRLERNGRPAGMLRPARFDFNDYGRLPQGRPDPLKITSEIFIRSTPVEDVYIALLQHDPERQAAAFKLVILPFTWWFWFGGVVLVAGTLICLWPDRDPHWGGLRGPGRAVRALVPPALAAVLAVPIVVFVPAMEAWAQSAPPPSDAEVLQMTPAQRAEAQRVYHAIMTTCEGCAGKTLATASPSCYPSNQDKARIHDLLQQGWTADRIIQSFVDERGTRALSIPPATGSSALHWIVPAAGLVLGGLVVFRLARGTGSPSPAGEVRAPASISEQDLSRLRLALEDRDA